MATPAANNSHGHVRFISLRYDNADSRRSALRLVLTLLPQWAVDEPHIDLVRFTDGITNTLLKAVNRRPGLSETDMERDAVLLRAYGNGTDVLIDRDREAANHELLMRHGLAPELLARFANGMLYRFIPGVVAQPKDLCNVQIMTAVARHLAQWHATVPCLPDAPTGAAVGHVERAKIVNAAPGKPFPNTWTTMQKWILALPATTDAQRQRRDVLQRELDELIGSLSQRPGLGEHGLVFAHCDLLSANVIIHGDGGDATKVSFIDYEYGTPSPVAFDLANHFAEWAGYDCDYAAVPTRAQRLGFIREYIKTYAWLSGAEMREEDEVERLMDQVDAFRGVPGFYWGIWSLIQATISFIKFDYAAYAEARLGEYWAYKAEQDGSREAAGKEMPLREKMWARGE
ncbi:hypothetical protein CDD82_7402 [Ophiocordyceps australis]|uniref:ethanolamine kinase n=1 Tax=Ophiocordyceps australis TaxID=1399860 RepID=A0A2C5YKE8_9HYPO|nr:hypothetical protein CDD82_7402 [Ophiocordyceps australis]